MKEKLAVGKFGIIKYSGNGLWLKWIACLNGGDKSFSEDVGFELLPLSLMFAVHLSSRISKQNSNRTYTAGDTDIFMRIKLFFHWLCAQERCGSVTLQVFPVVFSRSKNTYTY